MVTGGGQGVGRRISLRLAEEGAYVAVNDLIQERADAVADEINCAGGKAISAVADVTKLELVRDMADCIKDQLGAPSILVSNAGIIPERRSG